MELVIPEAMKSWWVIVPLVLFGAFWAGVEFLFYLYFRFYMLPFANTRLPHGEYKHYGRNRHKYALRIMHRIIRKSATQKTHPLLSCCLYYLQWYEYKPMTAEIAKAIPEVIYDPKNPCPHDMKLDDAGDEVFEEYWELLQNAMNACKRDDAEKFICWALFGKHKHELEDWEIEEVNKGHEIGEDLFGFEVKPGFAGAYFPKVLLSLEDCFSFHRPLAFYGAVELFKQCGYKAFRLAGLKLYVTKTGLRCWYVLGKDNCDLLPVLLFQGISPGGPIYYLPFILSVLARDGRSVFFFECEAVQCTPRFNSVISEDDTVSGVREVVDNFFATRDRDLCVMGHSFGSCQLTFLIHSALREKIKQFVILEPASLMLSESDVILNMHKRHLRVFVDIVMEWYIRRKFEWYNCELWLDDIPLDCQVIVALAGRDFILNSTKLREEVESYSIVNKQFADRTKLLIAKNGVHGDCLINPFTMQKIRESMLQQQLVMMHQKNGLLPDSGTKNSKKLLLPGKTTASGQM